MTGFFLSISMLLVFANISSVLGVKTKTEAPQAQELVVDRTTMTAEGGPQYEYSTTPGGVIDGSTSTIWHTRSAYGGWIQLTMTTSCVVARVSITEAYGAGRFVGTQVFVTTTKTPATTSQDYTSNPSSANQCGATATTSTTNSTHHFTCAIAGQYIFIRGGTETAKKIMNTREVTVYCKQAATQDCTASATTKSRGSWARWPSAPAHKLNDNEFIFVTHADQNVHMALVDRENRSRGSRFSDDQTIDVWNQTQVVKAWNTGTDWYINYMGDLADIRINCPA